MPSSSAVLAKRSLVSLLLRLAVAYHVVVSVKRTEPTDRPTAPRVNTLRRGGGRAGGGRGEGDSAGAGGGAGRGDGGGAGAVAFAGASVGDAGLKSRSPDTIVFG